MSATNKPKKKKESKSSSHSASKLPKWSLADSNDPYVSVATEDRLWQAGNDYNGAGV
jgi:hypothetical protein